jgi:hypothetical protein
MGFEKVILEKVAEVLKSDNQATFFCGSLSVICNQADARKIQRRLTQDRYKVEMNKDGSYGYIFDFVA